MRHAAPLALLLAACAASTAPRTQPPTDTGVVTVFADEFDGDAIDRARWDVYTGPVYNNELQEYVDDPSTMRIVRGAEAAGASGGALLIEARHHPGRKASGARADFTSGRLHGRSTFTFGTAAARMKLPAGAGLWPAFWLLGVGSWPDHGEIDIMENVGDPSWWSVALHGPGYSGNTPIVKRDTFPAPLDATAWHVYEAVWAPDGITFRVDGRTVYEVSRAQVARYGAPAAVDSAKYVILNLALGGDYPAGVNGVSAPYHGLPESSVQAVAAGRARVLVDWVRVTRREAGR